MARTTKTDRPTTRTAPATHHGDGLTHKLWAAAGLVTFGLGAAGVVLPVLPTTPFILIAAFCFARSSEKIDAWFRSTRLYQQVFETYLESREMTVRGKLTILVPVTLLLGIAAFFMRRITWMLVVFAVVWIGHLVYFGFIVKTKRKGA